MRYSVEIRGADIAPHVLAGIIEDGLLRDDGGEGEVQVYGDLNLNPQGSLSYECPECQAEVDIRTAVAL